MRHLRSPFMCTPADACLASPCVCVVNLQVNRQLPKFVLSTTAHMCITACVFTKLCLQAQSSLHVAVTVLFGHSLTTIYSLGACLHHDLSLGRDCKTFKFGTAIAAAGALYMVNIMSAFNACRQHKTTPTHWRSNLSSSLSRAGRQAGIVPTTCACVRPCVGVRVAHWKPDLKL